MVLHMVTLMSSCAQHIKRKTFVPKQNPVGLIAAAEWFQIRSRGR